MNDKITEIVDQLYVNACRFLKEDDVYAAIEDTGLSAIEVNRIITRLQSMGVIIDADIKIATKQKPKNITRPYKKSPCEATTFEMLNIPIGTELTFVKDHSIKATTFDNKNRIKLQDGGVLTISKAARNLNIKMGYADTSYQGPVFWLLDGKTLWEIRHKIGGNNE